MQVGGKGRGILSSFEDLSKASPDFPTSVSGFVSKTGRSLEDSASNLGIGFFYQHINKQWLMEFFLELGDLAL